MRWIQQSISSNIAAQNEEKREKLKNNFTMDAEKNQSS